MSLEKNIIVKLNYGLTSTLWGKWGILHDMPQGVLHYRENGECLMRCCKEYYIIYTKNTTSQRALTFRMKHTISKHPSTYYEGCNIRSLK